MSPEPDTRPFTSAELRHFLEQFELDRPAARSSVVTARAPRILGNEPRARIVGHEPRTMLGMGGLPARPQPAAGRGGAAGSARTPVPYRGTLRTEHRPRSVLREARPRVELVCAALIATALFVAVCWGVAILAGPARAGSTVSARSRAHRAPPPLPLVAASAARSTLPAARASGASTPTTTSPSAASLAAVGLVPPGGHRDAATISTRSSSQQPLLMSPQAAPPLGRARARREAVDLLIAGDTRAALLVYRELPLTLRAEPALARVIRLLERELRACDGLARVACGT